MIITMIRTQTSTFIFTTTFSCVLSTIVYTSSGIIKGTMTVCDGIVAEAYLGIPFAKPPVGGLRFLKPVPIEPWSNPLEAKSLPPGCPQFSNNPFPWLDNLPGLSTDCLYLNIWVPPSNSNTCRKKSVMFYIHIGGFGMGSTRMDFYDGRFLATEGDVIVVTTNYRLGVEGFFNSYSEDAPGNMGIYDIIESLKWVRRNIEYFGGDKDSITLFGTSAGGIVIGMFTVSPLTKGLFKRAILQSGAPTNLDGEDNDNNFKTSLKVAEAVGCASANITLESYPEAVVKCMRGKDPFELAKIQVEAADGNQRPFYPSYCTEILPENPRISIFKGDFESVDLMIGTNNGDGSLIITKAYKHDFGFFGEKNPRINRTFGEDILRKRFRDHPDPEAVVEHYLGHVREDDYDEIRFQVITATADYSIICPSVFFAESFANKTRNVYYYFFTNIPSNTPWAPWMLSVHHDETPFVFGYPLRYPANYSWGDRNLSRRMIQAWSSFAKTGHPQLFDWPQYSKESPLFQTLNSHADYIGHGPHRTNCDFFRETFGYKAVFNRNNYTLPTENITNVI